MIGDVEIRNQPNADLLGLACLKTVSGSLTIADNEALESLEGLERLTTIGGKVQVSGNPKLGSLSALSLQEVGEIVSLRDNPLLRDLQGLEDLTSLEGLELRENDGLASLNGMQGLERLELGIILTGAPDLVDLQGLEALENSGYLRVERSHLTSLSGLHPDIQLHMGIVAIVDNLQLEDITALETAVMDPVDNGGIIITGNSSLEACAARSAAEALQSHGWNGVVEVADNEGECESG